jgi:hypothetical protein
MGKVHFGASLLIANKFSRKYNSESKEIKRDETVYSKQTQANRQPS